MKHGIVWWIFIGWWWYLCIAWWLYPIKWILSKKSSNRDNKDVYQLKRETAESIIDFLKNSGGTALPKRKNKDFERWKPHPAGTCVTNNEIIKTT